MPAIHGTGGYGRSQAESSGNGLETVGTGGSAADCTAGRRSWRRVSPWRAGACAATRRRARHAAADPEATGSTPSGFGTGTGSTGRAGAGMRTSCPGKSGAARGQEPPPRAGTSRNRPVLAACHLRAGGCAACRGAVVAGLPRASTRVGQRLILLPAYIRIAPTSYVVKRPFPVAVNQLEAGDRDLWQRSLPSPRPAPLPSHAPRRRLPHRRS